MTEINQWNIILLMIATIFGLGIFSFVMGIIVLVTKAMGKDVQKLATQTAKLAQKGITDDITGLVGNASALMTALQEMVKTVTGIGLFLIVLGITLMAIAYWLFFKFFEIS
ncbi:MAG: hypothetical protein PVF83_17395 [Anaerolineales bacterium]|jgi:uncharacterized protein YoxC